MKTRNLFLSLLAVATFTSCSNEDTPQVPQQTAGRYVAVNINNNIGSRAAGDKYEDGLATENNVVDATFFFFDASGAAYDVTGSGQNVLTQAVTMNPNDPVNDNVEEISNVVLVINGKKQVPPANIVAVLNAPTELKVTQSLATLKATVQKSLKNGEDFIMSNSVYKNETTGLAVIATELLPVNVGATAEEANANPVNIYVERLAAKVRVNGISNNIAVKDGEGNAMQDSEGKDIYAKVLGWQVTNVVDETYTFKNINVAWDNSALGFTWNDAPYFRSYWAETKSSLDAKHSNTWNDLATHNVAYDYYFENTLASTLSTNGVDEVGAAGSNYPQLLVAAEFVDVDGNPLSIAEWYGTKYTLDNLKVAIANTAAAMIYVKSDLGELSSIQPADLDFYQTAPTVTDNRYLCFVKVAQASETKTFCNSEGVAMSVDEVNAYFAKLSPAKIWGEGGYYYFNIKHLGTDGTVGQYGLVRNHIYDITIDGVTGLGTPVYNPDHIITPEKPDEEEKATYVSARINILSWRVVTNTVILQ